MPIKTPKLILLDFDGTLADTFKEMVDINNKLYKELGTDPIDYYEAVKLREVPMRNWLKIIEIPLWKVPKFIRTIINELEKRISSLEIFPDMKSVIQAIVENKIMLGVVTTNSAEYVKEFLKLNGLSQISFVKHADFLAGKTGVIKKTLNEFKLSPDEVVYIGDTVGDIKDSKRAGIKCIAVTWGYNSEGLLKKYEPEEIVNKPEEILNLLNLSQMTIAK
ncbi:hypothetical protein A3F07_01750 [candidate division WWE3 bacterium RIFCSPHIGHO2_12_FULL_38_15]|uniref:Carotenoid oxygenase n=1 Tax=candidate division WWE3 bacterium RIFCSPHIGHO2_02_FULL_38_14 TaxID=1802620 RepID=A0A1F4V914_UNCKA|nr:MAG: hypothetical protein A2793_01550 [candidate division WWE3 bacterium RIFCSPHIGHO2_01_FULL_38_45]OGC48427.1 MAG: hypothetical protein A3F07_01750 [candidate division WWE3 bacterium RIFCSPHIGHO2_12_FULL_38_15]OGC53598.1 MAG: hypothetical protein A3D91_04105 [candidate division WWE3 bacterium RIFCSPHIGHO2_02_FULL_38_14]OGC54360.1 MAG: hypothetical protein A3B64_02545 [candidate division WWE3 bacterium RIFCSPLOWO2_01_FULL_37_24]HLB51605.1 HAD hydrolase-like protein [Patescibacteria group bac